jgi:hypothetical protein
MAKLYIVIVFLFLSLFASLSSASGNPASLPVIQEDSLSETHKETLSPPKSNDDQQSFLNDAGGDVKKALKIDNCKQSLNDGQLKWSKVNRFTSSKGCSN